MMLFSSRTNAFARSELLVFVSRSALRRPSVMRQPQHSLARYFLSKRSGGSSAPSLASYAAKPPRKDQPSWKRLAQLIKDDPTAGESVYAARLRAGHDTRDHVEKIEEEILEEMAGALGRAGDKCNYRFLVLEKQGQAADAAAKAAADEAAVLRAMKVSELKESCRSGGLPVTGSKATLVRYLMFPSAYRKIKTRGLPCGGESKHEQLQAAVQAFNEHRAEAQDARRELIIHRQAVGFQTGNHSAVEKAWPLPKKRAALSAEEAASAESEFGEDGDGLVVEATGEEAEGERNRTWMERMALFSRR